MTINRIGGLWNARGILLHDPFETAVERALGAQVRDDIDIAEQLWSALANRTWTHRSGAKAGYSFRAAGDLIAALRGDGNGLDWYCCAQSGVVSQQIADAMAAEGWSSEPGCT